MFLKTPRISCFWGEHYAIIFLFISKANSLLCMQQLSLACNSSPDPPTARQRSWNGLAWPWTTLTSLSFTRLSQWVSEHFPRGEVCVNVSRHVRFIRVQPFLCFRQTWIIIMNGWTLPLNVFWCLFKCDFVCSRARSWQISRRWTLTGSDRRTLAGNQR